jgi:hypothetical protein
MLHHWLYLCQLFYASPRNRQITGMMISKKEYRSPSFKVFSIIHFT